VSLNALFSVVAFGAVFASAAGILALVFGQFTPRVHRVTRGLLAGYGGPFLIVMALWLADAIDKGRPNVEGLSLTAFGMVLFGTVFGFPVAYAVSALYDRGRPPPVDPGIFE
jgi:drug/metabolite transporter superfamily protein YnfA